MLITAWEHITIDQMHPPIIHYPSTTYLFTIYSQHHLPSPIITLAIYLIYHLVLTYCLLLVSVG